MNDLPSDLQARRDIEDDALKLGAERRDLESKSDANIEAILNLLREAEPAGIPLDHVARLIGVSRQTLYRWRDSAARLKG